VEILHYFGIVMMFYVLPN